MHVIQIGSLSISLKWLLLGVGILIVLFFIKFWVKKTYEGELHKKVFDLLVNTLILGFFIWKGSLIVLEPSIVMNSPLSLLYFTGGSKGLILAMIGSIIYFILKGRKINIPNPLIKKILAVTALSGLIGWTMYDFATSIEKTVKEGESKLKSSVEIGIKEGNKAPDFQLKNIEGQNVRLSDFKGKKVILNLWATWCPPCKAEMPHMKDFYQKQKGKDVEIVAVNLTTSEKNPESVEQFVKDYGLTFPVLLDENGEIGDVYQAITIPTSYFIDTNGIIHERIVGPMDKEMMTDLINSMN
ncbi:MULTISPECIES: redoxin domain-containing protein [Neobacillus]|uniref:Redoxin domain-containing protein n=1 Tax=Neobacillus rhizophilus TaxID=2833579 RepID=A0A942YTN2_9BACI|nr:MULTISPECIES: redoxin domain-containing protein [Neobacillus]MBS4211110.1 redoxin domain-containing protein [Neobacillus rhizophilus]MBU8917346.1 redoxin domain-containing protein [Bacillus sp. FJAT-29953]